VGGSSLRPLGWASESNPEGGDRRLSAGSTPAPSSQRFCTEQQDISHQCRHNPRIVTVKGSYKGIRLPLWRRILSKQNNLVTILFFPPRELSLEYFLWEYGPNVN